MRTVLFVTLGLLEAAAAAVLATFALFLPGRAEVEHSFTSVERVTERTGNQVRLLRDQVHELRQPELRHMADRLQTQMRRAAVGLKSRTIDFDTVRTLSDALGDVSEGLDGFAQGMDSKAIARLGEGLGATADFFEKKVAPTAAEAAKHLENTSDTLQADAKRLAALLREAPLDLKPVQEIHDGLARFSDGLDKMNTALKIQRIDTIREGFKGFEQALSSGADQVDRMAGYTYPVVNFVGLRPVVTMKRFWPEGGEIAEGMRKAAEGVAAAGKEVDGLAAELPRLRTTLEESKKVAQRSREALALALRQQDKVEPLLKNVPEHAARLAEELPQISADLARVLRETENLKSVGASLRQAQQGVENAVARWPDLKTTVARSATVLRTAQQQLRNVVEHKDEYERAMSEAVVLTEEFAEKLPRFTYNLEDQLGSQEKNFEELGQSIDEVRGALPAYCQTTTRLVEAARLLLWLVAAVVALHGLYLIASVRFGRQFSA